jgi:Tfp pilus assembly protein PilV
MRNNRRRVNPETALETRCHPVFDESGQSLLEVLVSVLFMASLLLMSLNFMTAGIQGNSRGREMSTATYLAQEVLEEMKMVEYDDLPEFSGFVTGGGLPGGEPARSICQVWEGNILSELASGRGEIDVDATASRARITVIVEWVDGVNKERHVTFETLISNSNST